MSTTTHDPEQHHRGLTPFGARDAILRRHGKSPNDEKSARTISVWLAVAQQQGSQDSKDKEAAQVYLSSSKTLCE